MSLFFLHVSYSISDVAPKPKKTLTITPKFARQKGAALKKELDIRAAQGFFLNFGSPQEQQETYSIMAPNFNIPLESIPLYVKKLEEVAQEVSGLTGQGHTISSGDYTTGLGTTLQDDSGNRGSDKGIHVSDPTLMHGSKQRDVIGIGENTDVLQGGSGTTTIGKESTQDKSKSDLGGGSSLSQVIKGSEEKSSQQEKGDESTNEPLPELLEDKDEVEEKPQEEKVVLKPFEYTLEPLDTINNLSPIEKVKSDELLMSILLRLMQVSFGAGHISLKSSWINQEGRVEEIPNGYFAMKPAPGMQMMNMPKPSNGFEAQYLMIKEQLIAFVGLIDDFKKRKELRELLGSEESDGTLKIFIDSYVKNATFDTLYQQLIDKNQDLLKRWIKIFEPCFFDISLVKNIYNQRIIETVLINIIVGRKKSNYGRSFEIASDHEVKTELLSLLNQLLLFIPQSSAPEDDSETYEQEEQSILKNKEDTKKLLDKFLSKKTGSYDQTVKTDTVSTQELKKRDIISLDKDYVLELYDQFNRLRANSHFEKMFAIIGQEAINRYDKDQSPLKNNFYPLLLWLFDREKIKVAAIFREMVKNQLFFNTEDPDIQTMFSDMKPWNMLFDFHNVESKKYKKKIDVVGYINTELKLQKSIQTTRAIMQRLRSVVVEQSLEKVKALQELLQSFDIKTDAVIDLLEDIIRNENAQSKLDGVIRMNLKKLINEYNAGNEKRVAIIEYLKNMKKLYENIKKPITKELYDTFERDNKKFKYISAFQVKPLFYDLYRMPATLYQQFVKIAGKKQLVSDIISEDDFYNYVVPYGMVLKVLQESQSNITMLRNSLNAMNSGVIKSQELYADTISKNNEHKTIIQKGVYKGKLQGLIDAIVQGDPVKVRQEIDAFVMSDAINPAADSKYKELINTFVSNLSIQNMMHYSVMMKVLNEGSAQCPDNSSTCLIGALPIEGGNISQKEKVRNAHIYQKLAGLLTSLSTMFNPGNQPLSIEGLKNFDTNGMQQAIKDALEKIKTALEDKSLDNYWVDQKGKESERLQVLRSIENHFNEVMAVVMQLKSSVGMPVSSVLIPPHITQESGSFPPPPPPNPIDIEDEGVIPPPPPPPPGL